MDNIAGVVLGVGAADGLAFHAAEVVGEIEVVGPGEIVVVFFVVEGPVVGVGHGRRRAHVLAHGLRIVQHFDLHGLVVALFAAVERAVVVLVPVLVAAAAGEGRIVGERHDAPVLAD